jgi:hypothetical protein
MAVGTIAAASLLIGNTISTVADHETEPALYLHLIFTTTFITGVFQTCLGFFRYEEKNKEHVIFLNLLFSNLMISDSVWLCLVPKKTTSVPNSINTSD